ncbi:hypothetical protein Mnod_8581 (plasmid) [Methylobacterium nodulans ORS 2060]|uniref:Uncharacterized protein n=1 Tax=Methylobacterium nodulans (strain LMG 21967 / CNCM I-2342 / ORS 2060) TaxID=460265 RepID=B8IW77_METNO|nr:hypothetical protein Mnod_8581 [Methylobacterium nodulans ORS 2060]
MSANVSAVSDGTLVARQASSKPLILRVRWERVTKRKSEMLEDVCPS